MAVSAKAVSVTTSATLLTSGVGGTGSFNVGEHGAAIYNNGSQTVYLGGSGVTTAAGFPLAAGTSIPLSSLGLDDLVYGIVAATTAEVRVLEID